MFGRKQCDFGGGLRIAHPSRQLRKKVLEGKEGEELFCDDKI